MPLNAEKPFSSHTTPSNQKEGGTNKYSQLSGTAAARHSKKVLNHSDKPAHFSAVKQFVVEGWLDDQKTWHEKNAQTKWPENWAVCSPLPTRAQLPMNSERSFSRPSKRSISKHTSGGRSSASTHRSWWREVCLRPGRNRDIQANINLLEMFHESLFKFQLKRLGFVLILCCTFSITGLEACF